MTRSCGDFTKEAPISPLRVSAEEPSSNVSAADNLCMSFSLRGIAGLIDVSVRRDTDPEAIGSQGLPSLPCHADVPGSNGMRQASTEPR